MATTGNNINEKPKVLFIEPFYGGSHKVLIDTLIKGIPNHTLVTLPAKKWHWRARCGALCISNLIPTVTTETILFCSSVMNLAELLGIRPDLHKLKKIVYVHENQLVYPVQKIKMRDVQYAYNQIITCLAADLVVFNSYYNQNSFLDNIENVLKIIPNKRPKGLRTQIEPKCLVLYFPIEYPKKLTTHARHNRDVLHIVWPHRWEFDKGPDDFFHVLKRLKANGLSFKVSVLGQFFTDKPEIFKVAKQEFAEEIKHFGYVEKEEYFEVLRSSHVVVSTAKHEFFGVAVLEATYCGCLPIVPNNLVYPEIYPKSCLYTDLCGLYDKLEKYCQSPELVEMDYEKLNIDFEKYDSGFLLPKYREILDVSIDRNSV